jgi:hypothetical protein
MSEWGCSKRYRPSADRIREYSPNLRHLVPAFLALSVLSVGAPLGIAAQAAAAAPADAATANAATPGSPSPGAEDLTTPAAVAGLRVVPDMRLSGVSCSSENRCVAVGDVGSSGGTEGAFVTIAEGVPGSVQTVGGTSGFTSVDCVSATTCYAAGTDPYQVDPGIISTGGVTVLIENGTAVNGGSIAPPSFGPGTASFLSLNGIGCSGTTTCIAVGYSDVIGGFAVKVNAAGVPGVVLVPITPNSVNGIECVQGDRCKINQSGEVESLKIGPGKRLRIGAVAGAHSNLNGGDCHQEDFEFCLVAGTLHRTGNVFDDIGTSGGSLVNVPGSSALNDVSCAGEYWCVAVGQSTSGDGVLVPIGWETPRSLVPVTGTTEFSGASCVPSGFCVAVGAGPTGAVVDSFPVWK